MISNKLMNIAITGSSGNLGSLIVQNMPTTSLTCIDIKMPKYELPSNANFLNYNTSDKKLSQVLKSLKINTVIHSAFTVTPIKDHQRRRTLVNDLLGTKRLFESALNAGVNHIVYISSTLAYGANINNKIEFKESDTLQAKPNFYYAFRKKLVEEEICLPFMENHSDLILTILRLSGVLGPNIHNYVTEILKWRILPFIYEGRNTKIQWLHENDFIQAVIKSVNLMKKGVFNITPNTADSFLEQRKYIPRKSILVPEKISRLMGKLMWDLNISSVPPSYLDFVRYQFTASNKKAREELKFSPKYTTKEALLSIYN
ncbi:MAG: GDP-L-fucose synthase [Candidatus Heimdallarchaeota archaeon LC_3]|nr:MAG: GDP-L-fucose synthase [Candidatus Heimdallarchaeota archaeon LC_3]